MYQKLVEQLLESEEPSIRWRTKVKILGENPDSPAIKKLEKDILNSQRVKLLLFGMDSKGKIKSKKNVYDKWQGAHWVLAHLADLGFPKKQKTLIPAKNDILDYWLQDLFYKEFEATKKTDAYKKDGVPIMNGKYRRCASQQGYALHFLITLGLYDKRLENLVERLHHWQWPDGGWNCDKNPKASCSSFIHTTLSMRGLNTYAKEMNCKKAKAAAKKASEVLLSRHLYKRRSNNKVIKDEFVTLHYPLYWHYDILGSLKAMAECGFLKDKRCSEALDLLEDKQLKNGGWAAEKKYYKPSKTISLNADYADWGPTGKTKLNEWVTTDALYVLKEAGRFKT